MPHEHNHHEPALPKASQYRIAQLLSQYLYDRARLSKIEIRIDTKNSTIQAAILLIQEQEFKCSDDKSICDEYNQSLRVTHELKTEHERQLNQLIHQKQSQMSHLNTTLNNIQKEVQNNPNAGGELFQAAKNLLGHPTNNAIGMNRMSMAVDIHLIDTIKEALQKEEQADAQELQPYLITCSSTSSQTQKGWCSKFGFFGHSTHPTDSHQRTYTI